MSALINRMSRNQRVVHQRIVVHGLLVLETPAHIGNGDREGATDLALQRDSISDRALLSSSSIAGALRSYLRAREQGFFEMESEPLDEKPEAKGLAELLFGGHKGQDKGLQSPLIICDALSVQPSPAVELRDGVAINPATRTPQDKAKYDLELLAAGTSFNLRFELAILEADSTDTVARLKQALAMALDGLSRGEIGIGMKKRRGFGRCRAEQWQSWSFDLREPKELLAYLSSERADLKAYHQVACSLEQALGPAFGPEARQIAQLRATFALEGSLMIRAGQDEGAFGPDVRHLHTYQEQDGKNHPVLSGTSLAGSLRQRVQRIANTLRDGSGESFVAELFGRPAAGEDDPGHASRLIAYERPIIKAITNLVQNRIAIDRFTGGAYDGALFNEQPIFAKADTGVEIWIDLHDPRPAEIGMLLLLLKDLWTGDIALGGGSSVGRGRLRGTQAVLNLPGAAPISFADAQGRLVLGVEERAALQSYVAALTAQIEGVTQ